MGCCVPHLGRQGSLWKTLCRKCLTHIRIDVKPLPKIPSWASMPKFSSEFRVPDQNRCIPPALGVGSVPRVAAISNAGAHPRQVVGGEIWAAAPLQEARWGSDKNEGLEQESPVQIPSYHCLAVWPAAGPTVPQFSRI